MHALLFKVLILTPPGAQPVVIDEENYIIYGETSDAIRQRFGRLLEESACTFPERYARFEAMEPVPVRSYVLNSLGELPINWPELQKHADLAGMTPPSGDDDTAAVLLFFPEGNGSNSLPANVPPATHNKIEQQHEQIPRSNETKMESSKHLYVVTTVEQSSRKLLGEAQLVSAATFNDACLLVEHRGVSIGNRMDVEPCPKILAAGTGEHPSNNESGGITRGK